jgi:hypothetical protein
MVVLAALLVSTVGGWAGSTTTDSERTPASGSDVLGEVRALRQQLDAKQGELEVARLQLDRVDAIMQYSTHYRLPADMATAVYDVALSEGIDPGLAFRLVKVESGFNTRATSHVGAVGLTQVLPSTARLYAGPRTQQLYAGIRTCGLGSGICGPWTAIPPTSSWRYLPITVARQRSSSCWAPVAIPRTAMKRKS